MNKELDKLQQDLISTLEKSLNTAKQEPFHWKFDCATLDSKHLKEDIRESEEYREMLKKLKASNGPMLYWFKITSNHTHDEIRNALTDYKTTPNPRASSAMRKETIEGSRFLYVGKVKSNLWGRVIQHLGYNKNVQTSGLQLYHWAKEIGLKVDLNAVPFIPEMADLMGLVELKFAQENHPIIGKHS